MPRELKFRAWDIKLKHYVSYFEYFMIDDSDYITEQYTGIKDENNKEIYEGDIIQYSSSSNDIWSGKHAEVYYCDGRYETNYLDLYSGYGIRVIGNKIENPELL